MEPTQDSRSALQSGGTTAIQEIPVDKLKANPWNRTQFDPAAMQDLVNSIKARGIREPLIVRAKDGAYEIGSGNRRYLAAKQSGLASVPCIVRDLTDEEVSEMNIVANVQREEVPPMILAKMVKAHMDQFGGTQVEAATRFGKPRTWITELLGFLEVGDKVPDNVAAATLGRDQLRALKGASPDIIKQVSKEVKQGKIQTHQIHKRINQLKFTPKTPKATPANGSDASPVVDTQPTPAGNNGKTATSKAGNPGSSNPTDLLGQLGTAVQHKMVQHAFGSGEIGTVVEGWMAKAKGLKMWQLALILPMLFFGLHFFWYLMNLPLHLVERASNRMIRQTSEASVPTHQATSALGAANSESSANSFAAAGLTQIPAPTGLKAELVSGHRIHLSWTNMGPAYRYNIYSSMAGASIYHQEDTQPTSKSDGYWTTSVLGKYDLVVTAVDKDDRESDYSEPLEVNY